ncbi:MAG: hypothetical protein ACJAT4_000072 [Granulosicoccus sp.]|jgi:hypothetical protein
MGDRKTSNVKRIKSKGDIENFILKTKQKEL